VDRNPRADHWCIRRSDARVLPMPHPCEFVIIGTSLSLLLGGYFFDPLTEVVRVPPVVVTKHSTVRSSSCSQLRAEGSR